MSPLSAVSRVTSSRASRGSRGPYAGAKHEFMVRGDLCLRIPNPHAGDIGVPLLTKILRQEGISPEDWSRA